MKPQTGAFLDKGRELLSRAETMLRAGLNEDAGRVAYLAGFHAAQALIFQRDDRVFKTHKGVQSEFARLVKDDPSLMSIFAPSSAKPTISKPSRIMRPVPARK